MGATRSRRGEITDDVRQYVARARAMSQELAAQIEAFSARIAMPEGLGNRREELELAREELRAQNEALSDALVQVERERDRYLDLFDNAAEAYVTTDARGVIREANRAAATLLGIDRDTLAGKLLVGFVARRDVMAFRIELGKIVKGEGGGSFSLKLRARGGTPFLASLAARKVRLKRDGSLELHWTLRRAVEDASHAEGNLLEEVAAHLRAALEGKAASDTARLIEDLEQLAGGHVSETRSVIDPRELLARAAERARRSSGAPADVVLEAIEDGAALSVGAQRTTWALARLLSFLGSARVRGSSGRSHYVIEMRADGPEHLDAGRLALAAVHAALGADGALLNMKVPGEQPGRGTIVCQVRFPLGSNVAARA